MGYEYVSGAFLRSSVELRRIKNAKVTAMRHRKWQEVRLQREQQEKKAAEEFLKRRRKERARLATYIYSSAQNASKEPCTKPQLLLQEHINKSGKMWGKERNDRICRENNQAFGKESADKDIILDVCSLPTIPVKEKPCDKFLPKQYSLAGDGQQKAAATADFLQEALQERLENETATSLLIAEITDMKARLDDLLAVPSRGHYEGKKGIGSEHDNFKISFSSSDWEHDRTNTMQLMEREAAGDFAKGIQEAEKPECCLHQKYVNLAKENQPANRMSCCMHNACLGHVVQSNKNESNFNPCGESNTAAAEGKLMGSKFHSRPELKGLVLQNNGEKIFHKERVVAGATKASSCNHSFLSTHNQHDEGGVLKRVSQESCELEADKNTFSCMQEDIDEKTIITETTTGCTVSKENLSRKGKVALPNSKDKYSDEASNLSPSHKSTPVTHLHCSKVGKDNTSLCLRSKKDSAELLQFLVAENSLLSSLERLDEKLAVASTNISNSSRTSLVSAGRQSTKSAPCVLRMKPSSDAYSFNSTMFFSRPTTSHVGGVSLRRRQNVGLTNMPKDRNNKAQTCNLQQFKRCQAHPSSKHKEERKPSAGTIIMHQNAEFLFS